MYILGYQNLHYRKKFVLAIDLYTAVENRIREFFFKKSFGHPNVTVLILVLANSFF